MQQSFQNWISLLLPPLEKGLNCSLGSNVMSQNIFPTPSEMKKNIFVMIGTASAQLFMSVIVITASKDGKIFDLLQLNTLLIIATFSLLQAFTIV